MNRKQRSPQRGRPRGATIDENLAMATHSAPPDGEAAAARHLVQIEAAYGRRLDTAQRLLAIERHAAGHEAADATAEWLRRREQARRVLNDPVERIEQALTRNR